MNFECFCRLSPNHTYLTCRNFLCRYSVMAETTTVKQRAFVFIIDRLQVPTLGYPSGLVYAGAIFSAVDTTSYTHVRGIPPDCGSPGGEVGTVPFRLFPWPLCLMQTECSKGVGRVTSVCRFIKNANSWRLCASIRACVIRFTLSPVSSQNICVVIDVSSTIYLWLKPHLVKISSDIVTEYSCQVCILSMIFCRSDRRLCWLGELVSDCAISRKLMVPPRGLTQLFGIISFTLNFHILP